MGVDDERAGTESRTVPRDDVAEVLTTYLLLYAPLSSRDVLLAMFDSCLNCLLLTTHCYLLTAHRLLRITHYSLLTLTTHHSPTAY